MIVNEPDEAILSEDPVFNKQIHLLKNKNTIMKLSIGKEDSRLTVYIKGIFPEEEKKKKRSGYSFLPSHILRSHLFPYFTAVELFKLRLVSPTWKSIIAQMWHSIFKREMYTQFLVTNFTREIEKSFKLLAVRQPIAQKFYVYATTISEMIDWNELRVLWEKEGPSQKKTKLLITTLMKLIEHEAVPLKKLQEFDEVTWFQVQSALPGVFKDRIQAFLNDGDQYPHISVLEKFEADFMDYSEIWMEGLQIQGQPITKNLALLRLLIRHTLQYGIVRNNLLISKYFLQSIKTYMAKKKIVIGYKKGFLDGAYKIMIFKNIRIVGKEVQILDGQEVENSLMSGMRESVMLTNLLQSLFTNEDVLRAYVKQNRAEILKINTNSKDLTNIELLAKLLIEIEDEDHAIATLCHEQGIVQPDKKEFIDVGSSLNSGLVRVYGSGEAVEKLNPSFLFRMANSQISVFMDSRATLQFLNDSLKYLECVRQVKRLNEALMAQFETIQQKMRDIDAMQERNRQQQSELQHQHEQLSLAPFPQPAQGKSQDFSAQYTPDDDEHWEDETAPTELNSRPLNSNGLNQDHNQAN